MSSTPTGDPRAQDEDSETFRSTYAPDGDEPPSEAVVRSVAAVVGQRPERMQDRLVDVVDPDALDRLFTSIGPDHVGRATFELADCRVTVRQDGVITISFPAL